MSHAARLALRPNATIRYPSRTSCHWLKPSQAAQAVVPTTTSPRSMPSQLLAPASRRAAPPRRLPYNSTIQDEARKIKFFLHRCGTEKTKKSTKDGPLHGQDIEDC
ncbi:hypothetical protein ACFX2H_026539 [Malus domestica]